MARSALPDYEKRANELVGPEMARVLGLKGTRQLHNLRLAGMPARPVGNQVFYPVPAALDWYYRRKLLGDGDASLEASLYRTEIERKAASAPQDPQVDRAARAIRCVRQAVRDGLLASAHDVSDGGTAVALAEACIQGQIGAAVLMPDEWFGEGSGRFVVSVEPGRLAALETLAKKHDVTLRVVGAVGGTSLYICGPAASAADASRPPAAGLAVSALTDAWNCLEV